MENELKQDKPFMTYDQLIEKLSKEKKLEINNRDYAIKLLKEHSYFALISGYKGPFKGKDGNYKVHVSIQDIYTLYIFDDSLRALFLQYILKIEKHVKSLISYSFCAVYGENQQHYLNATKYNYNSQNQDDIYELITRLTKITTDPKNYPYIIHQKKKHGNIPLWVMMKALTLGTVSKMYSFLPQSIQSNVSKEFDYVHESMLVQMLDLLARVRNVCAHNERLFDYKYRKGTIDNTYIHAALGIPKVNEQYKKGKNDLFAVVIVLKYLLNENDFDSFVSELNDLIQKLLDDTKRIQRNQLYKYMGFPENWMEIKNKNDNNGKL
ncbi:MAG: Abi family protein [Clostridium sp.]|nr:Abi family protein [Clostridium sp.]